MFLNINKLINQRTPVSLKINSNTDLEGINLAPWKIASLPRTANKKFNPPNIHTLEFCALEIYSVKRLFYKGNKYQTLPMHQAGSEITKLDMLVIAPSKFCSSVRPDFLRGLKLWSPSITHENRI